MAKGLATFSYVVPLDVINRFCPVCGFQKYKSSAISSPLIESGEQEAESKEQFLESVRRQDVNDLPDR